MPACCTVTTLTIVTVTIWTFQKTLSLHRWTLAALLTTSRSSGLIITTITIITIVTIAIVLLLVVAVWHGTAAVQLVSDVRCVSTITA
jgi:hypothetical protein